MKKTVILYEGINQAILKENISILKKLWQEMEYEVIELIIYEDVSPDEYMNKLVAVKADYLITFAMAGFEWRGLMEQVRFNTLAMMQIHILVGDLPYYDYYLHKEYGIQNFFYTDNREIYGRWKEQYPQIPYMGELPMLYVAEHLTEKERAANSANLHKMIQQVREFIEKPKIL